MQNSKIHIVKINVSDVEYNYKRYLHWFTPEVISKIQSFRYKKDQVVAFASAILKYYYLAMFLNVSKDSIQINLDAFNRPYLDFEHNLGVTVDFNISHSGDYVIMAIAFNSKVGIDIEHKPIENSNQETFNVKEMSQIVFSASEQNALFCNEHDYTLTLSNFLLLWTKKEALLKAIGVGFTNDFYNSTTLDASLTQNIVYNGVDYICVTCQFDLYAISVVVST